MYLALLRLILNDSEWHQKHILARERQLYCYIIEYTGTIRQLPADVLFMIFGKERLFFRTLPLEIFLLLLT